MFKPRLLFPSYRVPLTDFKGHHVKALNRFQQVLPQLNLIFEIRDSRAPLSSHNVLLDRNVPSEKKIILYSKSDLCSTPLNVFKKWHGDQPFMFVDCRSTKDANKLIQIASARHSEMYPPPPLGYRMIITGMPNVGKSTLVNTLRHVGMQKKKVATTGGQAGVTRSTSEIIRVNENPDIYLYDTPGVFLPQVKDSKTMCVLSLIGAVKNNLVDPVIQADYLLYVLNLHDPSKYSKYCAPTNDINKLLCAISKTIGKYNKKTKTYDETGTAMWWVDRWRQGKEGDITFDVETLVADGFDFKAAIEKETERVDSMDIKMNSVNGKRKKTFREKQAEAANILFT